MKRGESVDQVDQTFGAAPMSRRAFLWQAAAGLAGLYGLGMFPARASAVGRDNLAPGAIAPEEWGPVGWYDVVTAYVDCDAIPDGQSPGQGNAFRGQVVFMRSPLAPTTFVYLAGRDQTGVVKGYRVLFGMDQHWSATELNISLGGAGGAQLRYDPKTGQLILWLNGFVIGAPEQPARRFGFDAAIQTEREGAASKSRVLEQGLGGNDAVQFYMRGGTRQADGSNTRLLLVAHLSIRQPMTLQPPDATSLPWPWLFPIVSRTSGGLYVTQRRVGAPSYRTFAWNEAGNVDLDAPTRVEWAEAPGAGWLSLFLPSTLEIAAPPTPTVLRADVSTANALAFTAEAPAPDGQTVTPFLALATTPLEGAGYQMAQTVGTPPHTLFLPLIQKE